MWILGINQIRFNEQNFASHSADIGFHVNPRFQPRLWTSGSECEPWICCLRDFFMALQTHLFCVNWSDRWRATAKIFYDRNLVNGKWVAIPIRLIRLPAKSWEVSGTSGIGIAGATGIVASRGLGIFLAQLYGRCRSLHHHPCAGRHRGDGYRPPPVQMTTNEACEIVD